MVTREERSVSQQSTLSCISASLRAGLKRVSNLQCRKI